MNCHLAGIQACRSGQARHAQTLWAALQLAQLFGHNTFIVTSFNLCSSPLAHFLFGHCTFVVPQHNSSPFSDSLIVPLREQPFANDQPFATNLTCGSPLAACILLITSCRNLVLSAVRRHGAHFLSKDAWRAEPGCTVRWLASSHPPILSDWIQRHARRGRRAEERRA